MMQSSKPSKSRQEKDSIGSVDVPQDALYGAQTARALRNFEISGRVPHASLISAYLHVKAAAARANHACGVLTAEHADLIARAIRELIILPRENMPEIFPLDPYQAGAGTSQNMNLNEVIANVANRIAGYPLGTYSPIHPNDHVNRSQSTNDSFPTAMRLALLETSQRVVEELQKTAEKFEQKASQWKDIPKSARTHLQDAVPMRMGQEFGAYATTLFRCAQWIKTSQDALRELGIGGSAAGTGLTVPKGYTQQVIAELSLLTGEPLRSAPDLCEAMQSQAPVMHYSSMLRVMALELTRICNDLRLLASGPMTGLAEILLPAVQPGSSIMPGKVNPSILEAANQTFFGVLGHDQAVAYAMQAGQLELNVMMPLMVFQLLEASQISERALRMLREKCIDGLEPNRPRLQRYYESTPQIATALSPLLGYEATASLVKEALASDKTVIELAREKKLLSDDQLATLLDPDKVLG
jgi:aspartate ammonia-lyase